MYVILLWYSSEQMDDFFFVKLITWPSGKYETLASRRIRANTIIFIMFMFFFFKVLPGVIVGAFVGTHSDDYYADDMWVLKNSLCIKLAIIIYI